MSDEVVSISILSSGESKTTFMLRSLIWMMSGLGPYVYAEEQVCKCV